MPECPIDARPTDTVLCRGCLDHLLAELRGMRWLVQQLTITLTRQSRTGDRNGPRSTERPLVFDLNASIDLETLRNGLAHWAHQIATRRGVTCDTDHTPDGYARWLLRWPTEIAGHPDAAELHGDILAMTAAARRTIDRHPDRKYLGPCDTCGADLYAPVHADVIECLGEVRVFDDATGDEFDPQPCGATYAIADRRAWLLEQAVDQLRTANQLSRELPWIAGLTITSKLIGMWAARGKLTRYLPHPQDERQATRFRVGEVIDIARQQVAHQHGGANGAA